MIDSVVVVEEEEEEEHEAEEAEDTDTAVLAVAQAVGFKDANVELEEVDVVFAVQGCR